MTGQHDQNTPQHEEPLPIPHVMSAEAFKEFTAKHYAQLAREAAEQKWAKTA